MHHTICQHRLVDIKLEMALAASHRDGGMVAEPLAADHGHRLALGRLTLPGMIEDPGSFSGRISSPRPERGPEPSRRISLAILNRPVGPELIAPGANTQRS